MHCVLPFVFDELDVVELSNVDVSSKLIGPEVDPTSPRVDVSVSSAATDNSVGITAALVFVVVVVDVSISSFEGSILLVDDPMLSLSDDGCCC